MYTAALIELQHLVNLYHPDSGAMLDRALILRFPQPKSFTGKRPTRWALNLSLPDSHEDGAFLHSCVCLPDNSFPLATAICHRGGRH